MYACKFAVEEKKGLKKVFLFADFFMFNDVRSPLPDFLNSQMAPGSNEVEFHLNKLFSASSLTQSWKILEAWRSDDDAVKTFEGRDQIKDVVDVIWRNYRFGSRLYGKHQSTKRSMKALRSFVDDARARQVEVTVVFLPIHATLLETLRDSGNWEDWENWKRAIVKHMNGQGSVWDFQTYSEFAITQLAGTKDKREALIWFKDPAHPKKEFCGKIFNLVRGVEDPDPAVQRAGQKLTNANIEAWLSSVRSAREQYVTRFPEELEVLNRSLSKGRFKLNPKK